MDLPARVVIREEGPREGFQIEPGPIPTEAKRDLIAALAATGLTQIQVAAFVSPRLVPGWADADAMVAGLPPATPGLRRTALWFSAAGLQRALALRDHLVLEGAIAVAASAAFSRRNLNRDHAANLAAQRDLAAAHVAAGVPVPRIGVQAAFGCNFEGDIAPARITEVLADALAVAADAGLAITEVTLADTMGWATPARIAAGVGAVRERWPELAIVLHLHDTRGLAVANAHAGLRLGVTRFDAAVGGLGGCPFAGQPGAAGNIATEELAFLCAELGIETGLDLEALIEAGRLAERIVGRTLPSALLRGGSLAGVRARLRS